MLTHNLIPEQSLRSMARYLSLKKSDDLETSNNSSVDLVYLPRKLMPPEV